MYQANCPVRKKKSIRYGKDHAGSQRWYCKEYRLSFTQKIDKKTMIIQFRSGADQLFLVFIRQFLKKSQCFGSFLAAI